MNSPQFYINRQLREELRQKKEKMDSYLKKLHSFKKDAGESQQVEKRRSRKQNNSTKSVSLL